MTAEEAIIRELSAGPKTLNYLSSKCAPSARWAEGDRRHDITPLLAFMVARGDIAVREWVYEKGRFVPIYYLRRRQP